MIWEPSGDFIRQTCEMIWDGAIGDVREVHAWTNASRWNTKILGGRPPAEATPKGVNWDLWLGPREARPYSSAYTPVTWRDFWDFGTAPIGDFFCHNFDPACWALDLDCDILPLGWARPRFLERALAHVITIP